MSYGYFCAPQNASGRFAEGRTETIRSTIRKLSKITVLLEAICPGLSLQNFHGSLFVLVFICRVRFSFLCAFKAFFFIGTRIGFASNCWIFSDMPGGLVISMPSLFCRWKSPLQMPHHRRRFFGGVVHGLDFALPFSFKFPNSGNLKKESGVDSMPLTSSNFIDLVNSGFYNGIHFHRVIDNFMVQFGCPYARHHRHPWAGTGGPPPSTTFRVGNYKVTRDEQGVFVRSVLVTPGIIP